MAELGVEREYTVYEDDQGREFFKQPQQDGSLKKVYIDEPAKTPEPKQVVIIQNERQPTPRQENVIVVEDKPPVRHGTETVLLVPNSREAKSPTPSRNKSDSNIVILVDNQPQTPRQQQPETIYITKTPEPVQKEKSKPMVVVVQEPEPPRQQSPEIIYVQNVPQPVPQKQPSQTIVMVDDNDPNEGGYYTPSPRPYNNQKRNPYRSTPRSQAASVSPWPRPPKREKPPPKYQLQPRPDQATTLVGGMLVIDNDPWVPEAKINHTNPNYRRGGGDVVIPQDKLKWKAKPRIEANNVGYVRGGGNVPILHENLAWNEKPRIDHQNPEYQRGGGNVVIVHENLKWSKNARRKARSQPTSFTARSLDSSGNESQTEETLSEGLPSQDESKPTYRNYLKNQKVANQMSSGYASQYKGKIHRYKATNGATPYFDLQKRKPMLKSDEDIVVMEEPKQPPPPKGTMKREKGPRQQKPNVPWFKQKQEKQEQSNKPRQYYPNVNKPLPPIRDDRNHGPAQTPKPKYVLPKDKSLPWQNRGGKLQKVNSKTLDAVGKARKQVPGIVPYNSNVRYDGYDSGYEDYNGYGNQYGQPQNQSGYKNTFQDRENLRENNKYNNTHQHHHFPTRKRNEPVY